MRAFHSVVKAHGGSKVSLKKLAAGDPVERDRWVSRRVEAHYTAHLRAACAAAAMSDTASSAACEGAAQRAFDEAMEDQPSAAAAAARLPATVRHRGTAAAVPQTPTVPEATARPPASVRHRESAAAFPQTPSVPEIQPAPPRHDNMAAQAAKPSRHNIAIGDSVASSTPLPEEHAVGFNRQTILAEGKRAILQAIVMVISAATIAWFLRLGPFATTAGQPEAGQPEPPPIT